jgi:molecular chaperone DnaJ
MAPLPDLDFYKVLQLQRTATAQQVKESYRRLALAHHPDKNPGDTQATARFQRVSFSHFVVCLSAFYLVLLGKF